ncbi:MAG: hypothetical protein CYG61_06140 [Actinobacteria bacterium]|nr:MAG: hypothetical protein CYG61_06140 [Actinomycetota bacterium]
MSDGTGRAEALLGLPGFRVLEVIVDGVEVVVRIETMAELAGCAECGTRAQAHDGMSVEIRELRQPEGFVKGTQGEQAVSFCLAWNVWAVSAPVLVSA